MAQQGALYNHSSIVTIANCLFTNNRASNGGAMVNYNSNTVIINCTFANNYASTVGGGLHNDASSLNINNSIIWGNTAGTTGNQIHLTSSGITSLNHSCYSNQANDINVVAGSFEATNHCTISNPNYVNASGGDYRICGDSPCADAGDDSYFSDAVSLNDIRGTGFGRRLSKIDGTAGTIDMGCYEYKYVTDPAQSLPTVQASNLTQSVQGSTSMTVSWTRGNGNYCAVFVKEGAATGSQACADNTTYTPSANWSSKGTQIATATGWYGVYTGTGTSVALTNLAPGELYRFEVFEYNGDPSGEKYLTTTASNNVSTFNTKATSVDLSAFLSGTENSDYSDIRYFTSLATAINNSATGSTITIKNKNGSGFTAASINTDNNNFIIDDGDLVLTSATTPIVGSGLIQAIGDGYLVMSPQSATALTYPVTDGTHEYSVTVTSPTTPTNPVKVRIHDGANENRALTVDLWDIQGDAALDATIKLKIPKASITSRYLPSNTIIRRKVGSDFVMVPPANISIVEFGAYYEVTIIHVNQF